MISAHVIGAPLVAIAFASALYAATDRSLPVTVTSVTVDDRMASPGGPVVIKINGAVRHPDCKTTTKRVIVDGAGRAFPYDPHKQADADIFSTGVTLLPINAIPGIAQWRLETEFRCNFFQDWFPLHLTIPSGNFTIGVFNG